jgi:hypothetical protein
MKIINNNLKFSDFLRFVVMTNPSHILLIDT